MMMMSVTPGDLNEITPGIISTERSAGAFIFPGNFEVELQAPLDARMVVGSIDELIEMKLGSNTSGGLTNKFEYYGMLVAVSGDERREDGNGNIIGSADNDGVYRLKHGGNPRISPIDGYDSINQTISPNGAADSGWEKLGTGGNNGDDNYITDGVVTIDPAQSTSILTLNYNNSSLDPITIDFSECCGGSLSEFYDSAYYDPDNDVDTVATVGGVQAGTSLTDVLQGKTFSQVFDLMFFPTQQPNSSPPSAPLSWDVTNTIQWIGDTLTEINFATGANGGGWSPNYPQSNPPVIQPDTYAGDVLQATISYDGTGSSSISSDPNNPTVLGIGTQYNGNIWDVDDIKEENYVVAPRKQEWTYGVEFDDGTMGIDSSNGDTTKPLFSKGFKYATPLSIDGTHPIYYNSWSPNAGETWNVVKQASTTSSVTIQFTFSESDAVADNVRFTMYIPTLFGETITNMTQKIDSPPSSNPNAKDQFLIDSNFMRPTEIVSIGNVEYHKLVNNKPQLQGASRFIISIS